MQNVLSNFVVAASMAAVHAIKIQNEDQTDVGHVPRVIEI